MKSDLSDKPTAEGFRVDFASYFFSPLVLPPTDQIGFNPSRNPTKKTNDDEAREERSPPGGFVLIAIVEPEARRIKSGKPLPFGTSLTLGGTTRWRRSRPVLWQRIPIVVTDSKQFDVAESERPVG